MRRFLRVLGRLAVVTVFLVTAIPGAGTTAWAVGQSAPGGTKSFKVSPGQAAKLEFDGASLAIDPSALAAETTISITSLGEQDLAALDQGMSNATPGPIKGYRFLPHTQRFKSQIQVSLPYDRGLIPAGLSEQDLRTYYFDDQSGTWQQLPLVAVDTRKMVVVSATDHFTDMINATLMVPEHPQALSSNPTSIKDIKAADPAANVNLIEAPRGSNSGDASLLYPIEVPPGRNGLQPQLGIRYNSSGGNGWLGLGWDLAVSSIAVDARWGVPRYDSAKETETYLLDGEQLSPVANRGELQPRTAEKEFHTRVESQFRKVARHGGEPSTYWWEVTDKTGTKYFYGGGPETNAQDPAAVLAEPSGSGHVFRWMLREVRDANGNTVRYFYDLVNGGASGEEPWRQIYLARIRYTGTDGFDGPYEVKLNRAPGRPDVVVDGRPGFKTVLADRLASIEIRLTTDASPLIRKYTLEYATGEFGKSLLSRVTQLAEDGVTEFNHHSFEYFDEVSTATPNVLKGFRSTPGLTGAETLSGGGVLLAGVDSTAFEADVTTSQQVNGSAGVSLAGVIGFGGRGGVGWADSITQLALQDLNGDGLLDQVYESDGKFYYRPNTGGPSSAPSFGPQVELNLSKIVKEHNSTRTYGGSIKLGISIDKEKASTTTKGEAYLTDVNGDGLPDLVNKGQVFYNRLIDGVPTFDLDSPVPMEVGAAANAQGMVQNPNEDREEIETTFHLLDPLRRWTAPYSDTVAVSGQVRLLTAPPADYDTADGVRVSVQHNGAEIWSQTIASSNVSPVPITGLGAIDVSAGDRLHFRVDSIYDGAFDSVEFNPTITYTGNGIDTAAVDENGMPVFVYNAASDYAYGGRPLIFPAPASGKAVLSGDLVKPLTTDDVTLEVWRSGTRVYYQTRAWNEVGTFPVSVTFDTTAGEHLQVRITADSRIDLTGVAFRPRTILRAELAEGGVAFETCADGLDNDGNGKTDADDPTCREGAGLEYVEVDGQAAPKLPNGEPTLVFNPPVTIQVYPRNAFATPYTPLIAPSDGTLHVTWSVTTPLVPPSTYNADLTLSIKRPDARLAKQQIAVRNGAIDGPTTLTADIPVTAGDGLYFVADATAAESASVFLGNVLISAPMVVYEGSAIPVLGVDYDLHLGIGSADAFGGGFRAWGYGEYNGDATSETARRSEGGGLPSTCADGLDNDGDGLADIADADCAGPIDESLLRLPTTETDPILDVFVQMVPFVERDHWRARDEKSWISRGQMSASRIGDAFLDFPDGAALGGKRGIVRLGGAKSTSGSISLLGIGGGDHSGTNWSDVEFVDFNGDRYPDVVGGGQVQTTLPNGALDSTRLPVGGFGRVRESDSHTTSVNLGATIPLQQSDSEGRVEGVDTNKPSYNLSAGVVGARGDSNAKWDLVDVNGDGLPDYVRKTTAGLVARLNFGYRFGTEELWASTDTLTYSKSLLTGLTVGLGGTVQDANASYSFGGGVSHNKSIAATQQQLVDVNGDGLVDIVVKPLDDSLTTLTSSVTTLSVRFNTGNGFTTPYTLTGAMARPVSSQVVVSRSIGAQASVGIPIGPVIISLGAGYSRSRSLGGLEVMLSDLDGDGYPDHVYSDTEGRVAVQLNEHGRTNLLKSVHRPLGAVITLDYARSGNTTDMPGNRWVLSQVAEFDGRAGDGDIKLADGSYLTKLTTYAYEGGRLDRAEREFLGFARVVEEERTPAQNLAQSALYRQVARTYLNSTLYEKGLLASKATENALGRKFVETVNTYQMATVADGAARPGLESYTATRFPQLVRIDRRFYEGAASPAKSTYITQAYDSLGNVTGYSDVGDLGPQDDVEASIEYSACAASYIVGVATKIVVQGNGSEMRRREAAVDCATGDLTQIRQYLADGTAATTDLTYFANGNLREVTDPPNLRGQRYKLTYEYDAVVQTYVSKVADSFGLSSSTTYNLKHGTKLSTTDVNNQRTTYTYDAIGRLVSVTGPYEQGGPTPTIRFEYHPEASVPWAMTRHLDKFRSASDTIDTVTFVDGFARVLQTKKDAAIHAGPDSAAQDAMIVSGRVVFDAFGRIAEQFYPVTESLGTPGTFNPTFDGVPPTRTERDVVDRVTKITFPDNTSTTSAYGFGADRDGRTQLQTALVDANGKVSKTYVDVRELVTSIRETNTLPDGTVQTIWTSYAYDPLKQLTRIEDDKHNRTLVTYDHLGRRISLDSPDAGETESSYDLASNVVAQVTANLRAEGKSIAYGYDFNRLASITYPDFPGNNVTYAYGAPGAPNNRAGRIVTIVDESGKTERSYGKLGEVVKETKTVASDVGGKPPVYTTEYVYDTFGRLQRLTYPDGEVLTYSYDSGGMVRAAKGLKGGIGYEYVRRLEYDKFEKRAFVETGNGVRTQYAYRPDNLRLASLAARQPDGKLIQNLGYQYDLVGNVLSLANDVPVPAPSEFGGPVSQKFTYDDLYRLVGAEGTYQFAPDKERQYNLSLTYDTIGNLLSKRQDDRIVQPSSVAIPQQKTTYNWLYAYDGAQPHAPTHLGDRTFRYDGNGNQAGWDNDLNGTRRTIVWDEENRIQSVLDNGHEMAYKYDADGVRVIKRGPQGETVYVNQYFTVRNGQIGTKHVVVDGARLVSKLVKRSTEEKDRYFYHPDHLGSSNHVTDAAGKLYEHLEYFPSGETWVGEATNVQLTPYLFSAKELDEETGLYYFGARYLDPRAGLFVSTDPAFVEKPDEMGRKPLALNLYAYALDNPINAVDPTGREPFTLYPTEEEAAMHALADAAKLTTANAKTLTEFGGTIFQDYDSGEYYYIPPVSSKYYEQSKMNPIQEPPNEGKFRDVLQRPVAYYHGHPTSENWSEADKKFAEKIGPLYLVTPKGEVRVQRMVPKTFRDVVKGRPVTHTEPILREQKLGTLQENLDRYEGRQSAKPATESSDRGNRGARPPK